MKVAAEWLSEKLKGKLSTRKIADALERAGVEVEGIEFAPELDDGIVIGKVLDCHKHPNADKLRVCSVDIGEKKLHIVCGAPNIVAGQTVAVAKPGAKLPDGTEIKAVILRGENSEGMICSENELKISDDHSGIMILPDNYRIGEKLSRYIQLGDVIDSKTQANRWDLQSTEGLAREVAAHSGVEFKPVKVDRNDQVKNSKLEVDVDGLHVAKRYQLVRLEVNNQKATPEWIAKRLRASGVRPISLIVDITNYCLLELGQPLHAFDAAKVKGKVEVRTAKAGESLKTLDGVNRKLDASDIVIADGSGAIGLGGVMGGEKTEVDQDTTSILLEAATFPGTALRRTAQRHNLRTDASARFERGLPTEVAEQGLARAIDLLVDLADAQVDSEVFDYQPEESRRLVIGVDAAKISAVLGFELKAPEIRSQLQKLGFLVKTDAGGGLTIDVPWWRTDISHSADIAEEVMRLVGYDRLPATLPVWRPSSISFDRRYSQIWRLKAALRAMGLFEVVTYSFISPDQVEESGVEARHYLKLQNPKSIEQAYLRINLLPSLLATTSRNRLYSKSFGMFEISRVYKPRKKELPEEQTHLAVMVKSVEGAYQTIKQLLDVVTRELNVQGLKLTPVADESEKIIPSRTAEIKLAGRRIGMIMELHRDLVKKHKITGSVGYFELDLYGLLEAASERQYQPPSKYPVIERDLAIVVKTSTLWQEIADFLDAKGINHAFLSDYYGADLKSGYKSIAIRFIFSAPDRTMTDAEADRELQKVLKLLQAKFSTEERK